MRVAIVHDWLISYSGSERVVYELSKIYPEAPIYTAVYNESVMGKYFPKDKVRTSFLQKIPGATRYYQYLLPLMPMAFENFDLRGYDLVVSSSHACAKGVITGSSTQHICYCHTPIRYAWSHYFEYQNSVHSVMKRFLMRSILHWLRIWDFTAAQRVDHFIANSSEVQNRIKKFYRRDSVVVHPPVDNPSEVSTNLSGEYYLSLGRLVAYKRVDLAVQVCTKHRIPLIVAGDGPESSVLRSIAGPTVQFVGRVDEDRKQELLANAKALLFCGEEDFGIVPVEALMQGTPVVGYGRGGLLDSVLPEKTGILFDEQSTASLEDAIAQFETSVFSRDEVRELSSKFSCSEFRSAWETIVGSVISVT